MALRGSSRSSVRMVDYAVFVYTEKYISEMFRGVLRTAYVILSEVVFEEMQWFYVPHLLNQYR